MSAGKLAAMAGHAFVDSLEAAAADPFWRRTAEDYRRLKPGTKVVLAAPDLDRLLLAREAAAELGLPHALVTDEGHVHPPHFDGSPIVVALGIGPLRRADLGGLLRRFRLLDGPATGLRSHRR